MREELVSGDGNTGTVVVERVNWSYLVAKRHSGKAGGWCQGGGQR